MQAISDDPVQALALLPLDQGEETERQWLQNTLAWLKSAPPETRTQRLRHLAEGMRKLPDAGQGVPFTAVFRGGIRGGHLVAARADRAPQAAHPSPVGR